MYDLFGIRTQLAEGFFTPRTYGPYLMTLTHWMPAMAENGYMISDYGEQPSKPRPLISLHFVLLVWFTS